MVTLPYVQGVTKPVQRILKHHDIVSAVRPHRNLRQILVHPKHKVEDWDGAKVVDKDTNRCAIWVKEAIFIRKTEPTINRD